MDKLVETVDKPNLFSIVENSKIEKIFEFHRKIITYFIKTICKFWFQYFIFKDVYQ